MTASPLCGLAHARPREFRSKYPTALDCSPRPDASSFLRRASSEPKYLSALRPNGVTMWTRMGFKCASSAGGKLQMMWPVSWRIRSEASSTSAGGRPFR
jgi:hypothetical protein